MITQTALASPLSVYNFLQAGPPCLSPGRCPPHSSSRGFWRLALCHRLTLETCTDLIMKKYVFMGGGHSPDILDLASKGFQIKNRK